MTKRQRSVLLSLLTLSLILSFAAGYGASQLVSASRNEFALLKQARDLLAAHAFDELPDNRAMEYGMIRGMLNVYGDPYTSFVEPPQHELASDSLAGSFGGIGARLARDEEFYVVLFPFPDGPAAETGILDGDRLVAVDGASMPPDTPFEDIQAAVRGPEGEPVEITIQRPPDYQEHTFTIIRENFALPSVTWHLAPENERLGVIEINLIAASTVGEIERSIEDLRSQGATHFALDLRDNSGGLLDAGIDIARLFLDDGIVIQQQYRGQSIEAFEVKEQGEFYDIPLVVLVNENTASAAEIIAGALQAQGRAQLIGTPTFGKDSIQLVFELEDGSSLHITSARWWFPEFEFPVNGAGLKPDLPVAEDTPGPDAAITLALEALFGQ